MIAPARTTDSISPVEDRFLDLLPTIRRVARMAFRHWGAEAREDAVAEIIANSFAAFARLVARGKVDVAFATALARFAIRQFHGGRRVGNRFTIRDVMSPAAQRRRGFAVEQLDHVDLATGEWVEAVVDDTSTPVADQAAFRCDFPAWLRKQSGRNRRLTEALSVGHTTADVARRFRISAARVSQLRRELYDSWRQFHGEASDDA
ncbi:MAG: hypothetical protein JNL96_01780 [Planctomycetaceae bacterium]|nr:hypothetical protein [Planctomycetaceae bacterium]